MLTNPLNLEVYDGSGQQYFPAARDPTFAKAMQGGEDVWLSYVLDREPNIDYPDIGYGYDVIARRGLDAIWAGEIREITQDKEEITIGCLGRYIHLDDFGYGGEGRLWCESRYGKWKGGMTPYHLSTYQAAKYAFSTHDELFIAPRKGENFLLTGYYGGLYYYCPYGVIERISFEFDFTDPGNWELEFLSMSGTPEPGFWGLETVEWTHTATGTGVKDITLSQSDSLIIFRLYYNAGVAQYTGETGVNCYARITNLRIWGQIETESPSVIHIAEKAVEQVEAVTPISDDEDLLMESMFVRDYFTDPNGTSLINHAPDIDKERGGWSIPRGNFWIQSNQAECLALGAGNEAVAIIDAGQSDGVISCDFPSGASGAKYSGIVFRFQDIDNFWLWQLSPSAGTIELYYKQAAGWNLVTSIAIGIQYNFTYNLMVMLREDRIDCYLGGIWHYGTNNSFLQTRTDHGVRFDGANGVGLRADNFEIFQALPIWPLFYEKGESCYDATEDTASFGDWNMKALAWGVEPGGDRVFLRNVNRERVRYIVEPQYAQQIVAKGYTHKDFVTSAWAKYTDEEGIERWTEKYYAHVTPEGIEANTTATGNDLASTVYGVDRDRTLEFGRVDRDLAIIFLRQYLREHAHPAVKSTFRVFGPVKDLFRGGAEIDVSEMEMGYLVQIPWFRAVEAEGAADSDIRDWSTTFLLIGMEYDAKRGIAKLIPEGATEDLRRMIQVARQIESQQGKLLLEKRPWFPFM